MASDKEKDVVLLITAFEPFAGAKTNASQIMLEKLAGKDWEGRVAFLGPVPVTFEDAWPVIRQEMKRYPNLKGVLAMGQAEGRAVISLERLALNWMDASIPDNAGMQPRSRRITQDAPTILWSSFPWNDIEKSPHWEKSYSAGAYVCNHVMYNLVEHGKKEDLLTGFIHIPLLESQGADPALRKKAARMKDDVAEESLSRIIRFSLDAIDAELGIRPKPSCDAPPARKPDAPPQP